MSDLVFLPAHQLAQMIRDRHVSAVEVFDAYLAQIYKHNSQWLTDWDADCGQAMARNGVVSDRY